MPFLQQPFKVIFIFWFHTATPSSDTRITFPVTVLNHRNSRCISLLSFVYQALSKNSVSFLNCTLDVQLARHGRCFFQKVFLRCPSVSSVDTPALAWFSFKSFCTQSFDYFLVCAYLLCLIASFFRVNSLFDVPTINQFLLNLESSTSSISQLRKDRNCLLSHCCHNFWPLQ